MRLPNGVQSELNRKDEEIARLKQEVERWQIKYAEKEAEVTLLKHGRPIHGEDCSR